MLYFVGFSMGSTEAGFSYHIVESNGTSSERKRIDNSTYKKQVNVCCKYFNSHPIVCLSTVIGCNSLNYIYNWSTFIIVLILKL